MTSWTVASEAFLPTGFPQQEYWTWLPFPTPGALPNPGSEPRFPAFPALSGFFATVPPKRNCKENLPAVQETRV